MLSKSEYKKIRVGVPHGFYDIPFYFGMQWHFSQRFNTKNACFRFIDNL